MSNSKITRQALIRSKDKTARWFVLSKWLAKTTAFYQYHAHTERKQCRGNQLGAGKGKINHQVCMDEPIADDSEPALWVLEIFHLDGTSYKQQDVDRIKSQTGK